MGRSPVFVVTASACQPVCPNGAHLIFSLSVVGRPKRSSFVIRSIGIHHALFIALDLSTVNPLLHVLYEEADHSFNPMLVLPQHLL